MKRFNLSKIFLLIAGLSSLGILGCNSNQNNQPPGGSLRLGLFRPAASCQEIDQFVKDFAERAQQNPDQTVPVDPVPLAPLAELPAPESTTGQGSAPAGGGSVLQSDLAFADPDRGLLFTFDASQNLRIYRASPAGSKGLLSSLPLGFYPSEIVTLNANQRAFAVIFGSTGPGPCYGDFCLYQPTVISGSSSPVVSSTPEAVMSVVDVTQPNQPVELKRENLPGYFLEARALPEKGAVIWVVENGLNLYPTAPSENELIPRKIVKSSQGVASLPAMECNQVLLYENDSLDLDYAPSTLNTTVISHLSLGSPDLKTASQALFSPAWNTIVAANPDHLFLAQNVGDWQKSETELFMFDLTEGQTLLNPIAAASVPGTILNQFFIDEKEGSVRVFHHQSSPIEPVCLACAQPGPATPSAQQTEEKDFKPGNYLSTYQPNGQELSLKGRVGPFEAEEIPYAARFMGALGCVITYRQIDPLTCFDLSNPTQPTQLGSLQISGVSFHLEPVTDRLLLGIGQGNSAGTVVANLFDIGDPSHPTLAAQLPLSGNLSWASSPVFYDYRALGKDVTQRNFAVPIDSGNGSALALFSVDPGTRQIIGQGMLQKPMGNGWISDGFQRAYFFDDTLATISYSQMEIFLLSGLTSIYSSLL